MKRLATFLAFALALGTQPASAVRDLPIDGFAGTYDFYLAGLKAAEMTVDVEFGPDDYKARSKLNTAGMVGFVYRASFEAETTGRYRGKGLLPDRFYAQTRSAKRDQYVEVSYRGRRPSKVRAEPAFKPKPYEIVPNEQRGTLDPISAALMAFAPMPKRKICNRTVDIFDGRRRYAIDLGKPEVEGDRIRCDALYRRVAGFKPSMMEKYPEFPMVAYFGHRDDGLTQLVRLTGQSQFGLAVMLLRDPADD